MPRPNPLQRTAVVIACVALLGGCGDVPPSVRGTGTAGNAGTSANTDSSSGGSLQSGGSAGTLSAAPSGGSSGSGGAAPVAGGGGQATGDCAGDDEFSGISAGSCYSYQSAAASWEEAEAACVTWGGHLAGLSTTDEHDFVVMELHARGIMEGVFVGANDLEVEGEWGFTNGEAYTYSAGVAPWEEGKPNDFEMNEDCALLDASTADGAWNDVPCSQMAPFVCER